MIKKLVGVVIVVALLGGAAVWWFALREDAPEELSVDSGSGADDGSDTSTTAAGEVPESFDGTWSVEEGTDTVAGFRITETFAGGLADHEAVGRSPEVTGSITVAGSEVTEGSFVVDLTALEFTDDPGIPVANRTRALQNRGLEIGTFPEATFELTEPVDFGEIPTDGDVVTATATGDLTIHGVTQQVTFDVDAKVEGATIRIATSEPVPVVLADHDIEAPTGGPVASVSDEGSFEFLVVLAQG